MQLSSFRLAGYRSILKRTFACFALSLFLTLGASFSVQAVDGTWTGNAATTWSGVGNWAGGNIADGAGAIADFSQFNISAVRTITIDGVVASRTVGGFLIGDSATSFFAYTIASGSGATLTFNNNGSTALLTQTAVSGANIFSVPIVLADNLLVTNNHASSALTLSGGITSTGSKNLTLNATAGGGITLSTGTINNTGLITNSGAGAGTTTISSIVGTNVTGVVQDSTTSQLNLTGVNTFSGGVTIKSGTLGIGTSTAALGTGAVTIGDSAGSGNAATLISINSLTFSNPIVLASNAAGTLSIASNSTAVAVFSGGVTGNNNLTFSSAGSGSLTFSTVALNNAGTITNAIQGTASVTISGGVGSNVTGIIQSSTTSAMTVSGPLAVNSSATTLTNSAGTKALTVSGGVSGPGNLVLNNNSALANGITLSGAAIANTGTITNSGSGDGSAAISANIGSSIASVTQNSETSQLNLSGSNGFAGGLFINKGAVLVSGTSASMGAGTVFLGNTSGSSNATLLISGASNGALVYSNPITVQAGSSGNLLTISSNGGVAGRLASNITLNNNMTLAVNATGGSNGVANTLPYINATGVIGGTGNLTLNVSGLIVTSNNTGQPLSNSLNIAGNITTTGAITNASTGQGWLAINGNITSASSLNQNGATSMLSIGGSNSYTGPTNVNAGVLRITSANAIAGSSAVTVASGATLQMYNNTFASASGTLTVSGNGTSYTGGALELVNSATYGGPIALAADSTFSVTTVNNTFTMSGTIAGSDKALTTTGAGNFAFSGALAMGAGGLNKTGPGMLTLSGTNSFTGVTSINNGTLLVSSTGALAGGGNITFTGGNLRQASTNVLDYASRIVNSSGPISIDTNAQSITYGSGLAASNTGGFLKLGTGTLTLSGANFYTGITAISAGALSITTTSALPSSSTIFADVGGVLNQGGAYGTIQGWLDSGTIAANSTGGIALTGANSEAIDFTGFANLMLGASTAANYTGTVTPAGGFYRVGGGGAALTFSGTNALTGANGLVVGAKNGAGTSTGSVVISGSNDLTGATSVNVGSLTLSGTGNIGSSTVTVNQGAALVVTSSTAPAAITRAASLTLSSGTLTVSGNNTAHSTDAITGALSIAAGGNSTLTMTPGTSKNTQFTLGSYVHNSGGTVLFRGKDLGVNAIASTGSNSTNISIASPNLVGNAGTNTTDRGILVGAVGDTLSNGTGFDATGGLLTYDTTKGVRLLAAGEYKTSITDGQAQLDNILLSSTAGATLTTTLNSNTTINSLSIKTSLAASAVQIAGSGTLKLNSGVIYANSATSSVANVISNTIDFNGAEGLILTGASADLNLSGVLSNTGNNGLTIHGTKTVSLSGSFANTYTGTTTVNGGTLTLNKTAGVNAITGALVINAGGTVSLGAANQIIDSANVTVNGGTFDGSSVAETVNDMLINGGSFVGNGFNIAGNATVTNGGSMTQNSVANQLLIGGILSFSEGGTLTVKRSQSVTGGGLYDSLVTVNGGLQIANTTTGSYTPISFDLSGALGQKGGQLVLNGDVTFTGNSTNTNTTMIDAPAGSGSRGVIALTGSTSGSRTFNVGNGAASVDLTVTVPMIDGTAGSSGLIKSGSGTLAITAPSTYTGPTAVNAGTLIVQGSLSGSTLTTVNDGAVLAGAGTMGNVVTGVAGALGGAVVDPGYGAASVSVGGVVTANKVTGILTTGSFNLGAGAHLAIQLNGTTAGGGYDQISATSLTLAGDLQGSLINGFTTSSDLFFIAVQSGGSLVSGAFSNAADNSIITFGGQQFQITYEANWTGLAGTSTFTGGNDIALLAVPEPGTWVMLLGGFGMLVFTQRLRSRSKA